MNRRQLEQWMRLAKDELAGSVRILQDEGVKHFARPIGIVVAVLFAVYTFVYKSSASSLQRLESDLAAAKATEQYADRYKDLDGRLQAFYRTLPNPKDHAAWLLDALRQAMKEEGVFFNSLSQVTEKDAEGYILASVSISFRAGYKQTASWVARLERSKRLLRVANLSVAKDPAEIGMNKVDVTVTTMVPKGAAVP